MTTVFERLSAWRETRQALHEAGLTLGVVPTMGALHEGHLSLVRRSLADNDRTLVTIFVNRTQFDDARDLAAYPRCLESDAALLRAEQVHFVLAPIDEELYPDRFRYRVSETAFSTTLEGAARPGHFDGVLTVVLKLLQIASADRAYFGEKDWQQLDLIKGMAEAFFLRTEVIACPTVRDSDGLALSSRNRRLSPGDRLKAPAFYRVLSTSVTADGAKRELQSEGFDVDYVEDRNNRRLGAVRLGGVRLIDNVPLGDRE